MIRPLNDYYHVRLLEMPKLKGSLMLLANDDQKMVRIAQVISAPLKDELELRTADCVYILQHYGQKVDVEGELLIKAEYILAEYIDK
jgi:hypothetical protein